MSEYQENNEKGINLVELLFFCLKKWRWIACSMIVVAVSMGGYKYLSTVKNNQFQQQALLEDENVPAETIKNPRVRYYEQAIASSEQELEKQEAYLRDSVVMQMDANHLQTGILNFYLDVAEEQGENSLNNLFAVYKAYVTDGRLAKEIFDLDDSIPVVDLGYLLSFNKERETLEISLSNVKQNSNRSRKDLYLQSEIPISESEKEIFQIQIIALNEEACAMYLEKIEEAIMNYSMEIQGVIAEHNLKLLSVVLSEKADEDMREYQSGVISSYATLLDDLKTLKQDMETVCKEEGEMITIGQNFIPANPEAAAVKYGGIGLVLGAFLAGFLLVLIYMMSGKLQSTEMFREEFGMQLIGEVKAPECKKRLFGFVDTWLYHLEDGAYANIPREEQIRIVSTNLKAMIIKKENLKKVMIAGTIAAKDATVSEELIKNIDGIAFTVYQQPVFSAVALEEMESSDAVLFLEKKDVSTSKLIHREKELADSRNVEVLGVIVL